MDRLGGIFGSRGAYDDEPDYSGPDFSGEDTSGPDFHDDEDTIDASPPSPVGQDERRMQVRAYNHWASLLADRNFPSIEDLDPASLKDFGPYSVLLDFTQGVDDPAIQYLGEQLAQECSAQDARHAIDAVSEIPARSLLSRITDHYMQILANQAPIGFEAEFVNQRGATALYRGILLPYSSDDETIDFIFGVINWKEVADQQTADELLLEIGQALQADAAADAEDDDAEEERHTIAHDVLVLKQPVLLHREADQLPVPAFGGAAASDWPTQEWDDEEGEDEDEGPAQSEWNRTAIGETARDYGLDDDYDEPEPEDVDDVVDPLADDSVGVGLSALIGRGTKPRPTLEMPSAYPGEDESAVPQAYEPEEPQPEVSFVPAAPLPTASDSAGDGNSDSAAFATDHGDDEPESAPATTPESPGEAAGLYDCLAEARELALVASSSEDRSRDALYRAVGRAYDFSIEAVADPEGFQELVADSGLKVQERAPMTPVVKLVFGADYDKTRVTEYAAVLSHAHRLQVERGSLARYLGEAEGGLKGVVQAERRARREEAGEKVDDAASVRESLAKKLRAIEPLAFDDLAPEGCEFALVMVRRTEEGELLVVGEIPEDVPLLERAARKLLG
ncbi:hypothetical protein A9995_05885 [Erythrobacter sp. QSSC1-22B]|uniref:PAS domain-containing protein n=1 Tax=Erythrobacter sp. QSSC1-22B TaxID=1860125 RepID=UPI0008057538|nr:hypothetical protein [Erythrobacter sp. QSSC1-22B]OBX20062.1 hypothetical protein A9995_05885 [Erythrobacter sp. QSSC1-22B]